MGWADLELAISVGLPGSTSGAAIASKASATTMQRPIAATVDVPRIIGGAVGDR